MVLLAVRLVYIQVVKHATWHGHAVRMETATEPIHPQRGMILDRYSRQLAVSVTRYSICANPRVIPPERRAEFAGALAAILDADANELAAELARTERTHPLPDGGTEQRPNYFVWLKRRVDQGTALRALSSHIPGLGARPETRRVYPHDAMLAHVLGFVREDDESGLEGLEAQFEHVLAGAPGERRVIRDGRGCTVAPVDEVIRPARNGRSLILSIDGRAQQIAEEELAKACEEHKVERGCAVVMDPHSGDVLAMANWPGFDPADFNAVPEDAWRNMAVSDCVEPGSTFKPFVVAAAIDRGVVSPETRFDCHRGTWRTTGRTLHDSHPYGVLSVRDIVAYSSNIGMGQIGMRMGPQALYEALRGFGFGAPTGIVLPGESAGILRSPASWSKLTITSLPMGQEVACSPLQLTSGFCVFANGGWLVQPRVVLGIADTDGRRLLRRSAPSEKRRVLSEATARLMCNDILAGVVEHGTAQRCALSGYRLAGKTGTAQIARAEGGGYEPGAYTAAFVGIAPAEAPRYVITFMMRRPRGVSHYGGVVAGPAVSRTADRLLSMAHIPRAKAPAKVAGSVASARRP